MTTLPDLKTYTDTELVALGDMIVAEKYHRQTVANANQTLQELSQTVADSKGFKDGDAWAQPTTVGYPKGAVVTFNGKQYSSTIPNNVWSPGSGEAWTLKHAAGSAPAAWEQRGSTNPYMKNDTCTWTDGFVYKSLIDNNVWSPATYPAGWVKQPK